MSADAKEVTVLFYVKQLLENVEALHSVLEGTWGMAKAEESRTESKEPVTAEENLNEIRVGVVQAIEEIQGLRERLQKLVAELA